MTAASMRGGRAQSGADRALSRRGELLISGPPASSPASARVGLGRRGASLVELLFAIVVVGVGVAGVASLTAASARTVAAARALDETHAILQSFADSARYGGGPSVGERDLTVGTLTWDVPGEPGAAAWVELRHRVLDRPVRLHFGVVADAQWSGT